MLHTVTGPITEDRIERAVERLVTAADRVFLAGGATQQQYDRWNVALDTWANEYRTAL
jgi:hypothetical protein